MKTYLMWPWRWRRRADQWFAPASSGRPAKEALRSCLNLEILEPRSLPSFLAPGNYDAGISPNSVAVGDFNGDGIPDLVATNGQGGTVTVLLGKGDGTFQAPQSYPAGFRNVGQVAVGDFNGDGIPDLAVTSYDQNGNYELSVLQGNGDGSFAAPQSARLDFGPYAIAVGDFNGDGRLDLALSGFEFGVGGVAEVLLGNGDGSFQVNTAVPIVTGSSVATSVAVGDFNGDGRPDLVVTSYGLSPTEPPNVLMLLGNGDGSFRIGNRYNVGNGLQSVVVGDFNGDGHADLAALDESFGVWVFLGNGDGTFQAARDYSIPQANSLAAGDTNGDGLTDLVVGGSGTGTVLLGNRDGSLHRGSSFDLGRGPVGLVTGAMVLADLTGDGIVDVVSANPGMNHLFPDSGTVSVRLGNGDGTFQSTPRYDPAMTAADSVAVGDFNGDGNQDIARAKTTSGNLSILLGNGDGSFRALPDIPTTGVGTASVMVADFNGDGIPDVVVAKAGVLHCIPRVGCTDDPGSLTVFLGNGDGTFRTSATYSIDATTLAVGDFNGDGIPDLAIAYRNQPNPPTYHLMVLLGNGDGTFQNGPDFALSGPPTALVPADVNGDGKLDLVMNFPLSVVSVFLGNGDGTFQAAGNYSFLGSISINGVAVSDLNGDGIPDLIVTTSNNLNPGNVNILLGNGDGTFQAPQSISLPDSPASVVVADFNGDGVPDLAVGVASGVQVFLGNGDGTFQSSYVSYGTVPGSSLVAGDFNNDGFPDLATGAGHVLLNAADWSSAPIPAGGAHGRHEPREAIPERSGGVLRRAAHSHQPAQRATAAAADRLFAALAAEISPRNRAALPSANATVNRGGIRDLLPPEIILGNEPGSKSDAAPRGIFRTLKTKGASVAPIEQYGGDFDLSLHGGLS